MIGRVVALVAGALMVWAASAAAGQTAVPRGGFSIWVPDKWTVTIKRTGIYAANPNDELYLVASRIGFPDANNLDDDAQAFLSYELDDYKISGSEDSNVGGMPSRALQGTGTSDKDSIEFTSEAIDPGPDHDVVGVLVYGDPDAMKTEQGQATVKRILSSLKVK